MINLLLILSALIVLYITAVIVMISIPPARDVPKLESVAAPFKKVDFSNVPVLKYFTSRNGTKMAYREYPGQRPQYNVVMVHGSTGSGISLHPLAQYLSGHGMRVIVPDMRGHGASGRRGDIDYIGQLEDDIEDIANIIFKGERATLLGFSLGGGFVLRFAAGNKQKLFENYILLSPYIGRKSPTVKPNAGDWADASIPRIAGISLLGKPGEKLFGHLPVITYGIDPMKTKSLVARYSYRLLKNMCPHANYKKEIASVKQPLTIIAGREDELHNSGAFGPLFIRIKPDTRVMLVPGENHITLTLSLPAMKTVSDEIKKICKECV